MQTFISYRGVANSLFTSALLLLMFGSVAFAAGAAGNAGTANRAAAQKIDIVRDPTDIPAPVGNRAASLVRITLVAREVVGELDPASGTSYRYWTFNGKVPGPMLRARQGDTIEVTLRNDASSHMVHSVDFHAAIGPGGGAALSQVLPGQTKTFTFQATTPGLFVYHCGTPMIADHIANGMYGLILVEPAGGLPHMDHEYYVMQGEIYTNAAKGKLGLQQFSEPKPLQETPEYFVFNGAVDALTKEHPLTAKTGETVRIFFGDAGPNASSSLHVVGEIFTNDYELGSLTSPPLHDVQTANVPPGGAALLELKTVVPGQFNLMDHAMARMAKGLMASLQVNGPAVAQVMHPGPAADIAPAQAAEVMGETEADTNAAPVGVPMQPVSSQAPLAMNGMGMEAPESALASPRVLNSDRPVGKQTSHSARASAGGLDGCLTLAGGTARLTVFHSRRSYRLEPRYMLLHDNPLAFAENANALVHVTGHVESQHAAPVFIVDSIDQLAPTCDERVSIAQLRAAKAAKEAHMVATSGTSNATVGMGDMSFQPAEVVITAGQQVTWKNTSAVVHNVVAEASQAVNAADVQLPRGAKPFASSLLQSGQTFTRKFDVPGTYRYVCTFHEGNGMKGIVIVRPATRVDMASARQPGKAKTGSSD